MLAVQQFEEALVGLIGTTGELAAVEETDFAALQMPDYPWEEWVRLFKLPAGELSKRTGLAHALAKDVERAITARNRLAHHYLRDRVDEMRSTEGRSQMHVRLLDAKARFFAVRTALTDELAARMRTAGLTDDHVTLSDEARRLRYYDPELDRDVPPEPFDE